MNVHVSYKVHRTSDIEKEISHQIEKVRKHVQVFRPDLVHLKLVLEENSAREGMSVSINLRLPYVPANRQREGAQRDLGDQSRL